ncbi:hypothetical protein [Roseisalinus antarcticus]|uniref:Uncharacterized protein n=1 Tax=Roseisalinus antarcticus TaxID=254357 RepID=A0A1Y5RQC9_9RHOB|nr:hypothetical protein [Roseisalinus antarcticus]SLN22904.1 hypothetical protein ROA7023_00670 [Roseisalinus antarcticus]
MTDTPTLLLTFSGWCLMRIPTDPDPTDEPRGVSGYTFAYANEPDLDRIILFHPEEKFVRWPAWQAGPDDPENKGAPGAAPGLGVYVRAARVLHGDNVDHTLPGLVGAKVDLLEGPKLENRNWLLTLPGQEPIVPFILHISNDRGVDILRKNALDPDKPDQPVWKASAAALARCAAAGMNPEPDMVGRSTGIWDYVQKNKDRRDALVSHRAEIAAKPPYPDQENELAILDARIKSIETGLENPTSDRRIFMTQMVERFSFDILGFDAKVSAKTEKFIGMPVECDAKTGWPIGFWIGGWDPDLLAAHVEGSVRIPLTSS